MKKALMTSLKISLGIFIVFCLLGYPVDLFTTYKDQEWIDSVNMYKAPIATDLRNLGETYDETMLTIGFTGMEPIGNSADTLYEDSNEALKQSNIYKVSPELQLAKDEYEQMLFDVNKAAELLSDAAYAHDHGDDNYVSTRASAMDYYDSAAIHLSAYQTLLETYKATHRDES